MERHELEDRIRASLEARANDVQPTPELWERVSERTTRRARWALGGWVLSGAAAVLAIVVGGMVLFSSPRGVQIDQQPDIADTPTDAPVPAETADPTIVTTDGRLLRVIEPGTGEVLSEVDPRAGLQVPATIRELAVRPRHGRRPADRGLGDRGRGLLRHRRRPSSTRPAASGWTASRSAWALDRPPTCPRTWSGARTAGT